MKRKYKKIVTHSQTKLLFKVRERERGVWEVCIHSSKLATTIWHIVESKLGIFCYYNGQTVCWQHSNILSSQTYMHAACVCDVLKEPEHNREGERALCLKLECWSVKNVHNAIIPNWVWNSKLYLHKIVYIYISVLTTRIRWPKRMSFCVHVCVCVYWQKVLHWKTALHNIFGYQ